MKQRSELARPPKRASEAELTSTAPNPAVGASRLGAFAANAERAELRRAHSARRSTPAPAALARRQARSKPAVEASRMNSNVRWRQASSCVAKYLLLRCHVYLRICVANLDFGFVNRQNDKTPYMSLYFMFSRAAPDLRIAPPDYRDC